jgi:hypothetical protein
VSKGRVTRYWKKQSGKATKKQKKRGGRRKGQKARLKGNTGAPCFENVKAPPDHWINKELMRLPPQQRGKRPTAEERREWLEAELLRHDVSWGEWLMMLHNHGRIKATTQRVDQIRAAIAARAANRRL